MNLTVRSFTVRAFARPAPVRPAGYAYFDRTEMHISQIDYALFFDPALRRIGESVDFLRRIENTNANNCRAKVIVHQTARLVWLGDQINDVAAKRPALQIMFYMIAAEAVAKIVRDYSGEGKSRHHVRVFFDEICADNHRSVLANAFRDEANRWLTCTQAVDVLYDIRCDLAHMGRYYGFTLKEDGRPMTTAHKNRTLISHVSVQELRSITCEGALLGAGVLLAEFNRRGNL